MQLSFTSTRFNNTSVVDAQTGAMLYDVQTPTTFRTHTTTVRNAQGQVVGVYERAGLVPTRTVTVGGARMDLDSWLTRDSRFQLANRTLHAPDGKQYHWAKPGFSHTLTCTDVSTGRIIAEYQRGSGLRLLGTSRNAVLNINPEAMHIVDSLLLSVIILEGILRAAASAAAAAG